ncbi:MAG: DNA-directed RNA polymerase subunit L [Methanomicrobiaceae archaeon]|nr:DNA-directed RNA polymerase subunit L [Methanomicrobiaceae archaeon]MDD5419232.1 DNA-directed RNA polymerase subunit L [Methanomicrobiaceae archaeon]
MKMKILELLDDKVRILFEGEGHTYMNALVDELLRDPDVDVAQYQMVFQFSDPELLITTNGRKEPLTALREAAERLSSVSGDLLRQVSARTAA